jgi:glycolate oxidase FAD binding subunit
MRDFVLGVRILTGAGQVLHFGGRVMKNVAGYDVTRLMVGALGTLGVLLEVSLKVLPRAPDQLTLTFALSAAQALERMNGWACTPLPISATCWDDGRLYVRLQGSAAALAQARRIGGEELDAAEAFWTSVKEHTHPFFHGAGNLWRLTVPSESAVFDVPGRTLMEWTGAQRWLVPDDARAELHEHSARAGGFATLFRGPEPEPSGEVFAALPAALMRVHRELKRTFDPYAILNPGRLYADL